MNMLRSFLPVGQGAFYSEKFANKDNSNINVIYDCGSLTNSKFVNQQIRKNYAKGEIIHAVFLSHLDEDHINGLPYLLQYCNVKNIFLPLLAEEAREYLKIYNMIYSKGSHPFSVSFAVNPYQTIENLNLSDPPHIYIITPFTKPSTPEEKQFYNIDDTNKKNITYVSSGENIISRFSSNIDYVNLIWQYIPFNFRQDTRIDELKRNLKKVFGKVPTADELANMLKEEKNIKKIKKAYSNLHGSFNTNSMVVYSGPALKKITDIINCLLLTYSLPSIHKNILAYSSGCLYMGDYDASGTQKWKELQNAMSAYWSEIGLIQIPHHGSSHNFNPKLIRSNCQYIISAGTRNRFRHPHEHVLKSLLLKRIFPYIVTEQSASRRDYLIIL